MEVETPIMQTAVSGAAAKPFFTHHNALNLDSNLRIAPETYLNNALLLVLTVVMQLLNASATKEWILNIYKNLSS